MSKNGDNRLMGSRGGEESLAGGTFEGQVYEKKPPRPMRG